jgi:putative nucleotidyltransferase with HDIG domain
MDEIEFGSQQRSSQEPFEPSILPLLERLRAAISGSPPVYLVGGAVRDLLLGGEKHDLDFVTGGDALAIARKAANALGGSFYTMDQEHETGRVILNTDDGGRIVLDFARQRGERLEDDLRARDFTINAMALDIENLHQMIDPLGGALDLRQKRLRACSPGSFSNDPVRVLRALRQAHGFGLRIEAETRRWLRQAAPLLPRVSVERQRDEIFRILGGRSPASVIRAMDVVGVLGYVLPEFEALKGVEQSPPHHQDVWNHTLEVLNKMEDVLDALTPTYNPDQASSLALGLVVLRLGRFRVQFDEHLSQLFTPDRSDRQLLFLAALYHDIAKPHTRTVDPEGRIRFFGHDLRGTEMVGQRGRDLHLSNDEIEHLQKIVRHHMRPMLLANVGEAPTRRAIYRFFRDARSAGVDICLLSVADHLATAGPALRQKEFKEHLDTVRLLLEAWWEKPQEAVSPPALLDGRDLMQHFHLQPGRKIGELLESLREAQAAGQIETREQAISFIQDRLDEAN